MLSFPTIYHKRKILSSLTTKISVKRKRNDKSKISFSDKMRRSGTFNIDAATTFVAHHFNIDRNIMKNAIIPLVEEANNLFNIYYETSNSDSSSPSQTSSPSPSPTPSTTSNPSLTSASASSTISTLSNDEGQYKERQNFNDNIQFLIRSLNGEQNNLNEFLQDDEKVAMVEAINFLLRSPILWDDFKQFLLVLEDNIEGFRGTNFLE